MRSFKGLFLLIMTNLLVFLTLIISGNILINFVLPMFGIDMRGNFVSYQFAWAMVFGFGGAFISLLMSKPMVKTDVSHAAGDPAIHAEGAAGLRNRPGTGTSK